MMAIHLFFITGGFNLGGGFTYFLVSPLPKEIRSNLTSAYFSDELVQPPPSNGFFNFHPLLGKVIQLNKDDIVFKWAVQPGRNVMKLMAPGRGRKVSHLTDPMGGSMRRKIYLPTKNG